MEVFLLMDMMERVKNNLKMSGLKEETCKSHTLRIQVFLRWFTGNAKEVSLEDVKEFLRHIRYDRNYSIGTVNCYRSSLKYFYEMVLEKQFLDKKVPRLRGYKPIPSVLSKEEVLEFISKVRNDMYRVILITMYSSGLRVGEVVQLKVKDIDSKRMQIYITKGKNGHARYAILSEKNLHELRSYVKRHKKRYGYEFAMDDFLFPSPYFKGNHISSKTIKNNILKTAKRINLSKKITSHTLRHSFATHLLESGVDLFHIKELLGHRCIQSTSIYLHLSSLSNLGVKSPLDE